METKKVVVLAMLLAVLAAVYFATGRLAEQKNRRAQVSLAEGFEAGKAGALTIQSPGREAVALEKKDGAWTVTSGTKTYAADAAAIEALLGQIGAMKSATVVSRNPKKFDSFEVSDGKAVDVKIQDSAGKVLAWLLLGKNGPDIFSTYVRVYEGESVYLVPGFLKNSADRDLNAWRDKALFTLDPEDITLYSVSGDKNLQLRKTGKGSWQSVCDGRVSDSAVPAAGAILRGFAALAAADFSDKSMAEARLDKPVRTITALLGNGSRHTLLLGGDKNAFQQFVKTGSQEQMYVVEKALLDSLAPSCEELKESAKAPDSDKAPEAQHQQRRD